MTSPNDLTSAHARIDSLERETRVLAEQNALIHARLEAPLVKAAEPTQTSAVRESSPPLTADAETSDDAVATWPVTVLVAFLAIATAAAVMFAGNT